MHDYMLPSSGHSVVPIVDAHLDLAYNAMTNGRDLTRSVAEIRVREVRQTDIATLSFPDLAQAGVAVVFASIYAMPANPNFAQTLLSEAASRPHFAVYHTPEEAEALAHEQIDLYERWRDDGLVRLITGRSTLAAHLEQWAADRTLGLVLLMEGADPIVRVADLDRWWQRGLRIIGLSWAGTRYAGGTGAPGGLTPTGRDLVAAMRERGVILDTSHLAEEAFWEALDIGAHAVIASHSNARALLALPPDIQADVPSDRHLTDEMISAIGTHDGVIGLNFLNDFLEPRWTMARREVPVTFANQGRRMLEHLASLIGWHRVGIGSDVDAGYGRDETPQEFDTVADYVRLRDVVPPEAQAGVLGGNWLRLLQRSLPD